MKPDTHTVQQLFERNVRSGGQRDRVHALTLAPTAYV